MTILAWFDGTWFEFNQKEFPKIFKEDKVVLSQILKAMGAYSVREVKRLISQRSIKVYEQTRESVEHEACKDT